MSGQAIVEIFNKPRTLLKKYTKRPYKTLSTQIKFIIPYQKDDATSKYLNNLTFSC